MVVKANDRYRVNSARVSSTIETYTATGSLNLPHCCIWYIKSPPFTYSITKYSRSMVWKQECSCTKNGGLLDNAKTRFSTIVHSTSSSCIMMSFFKILMAYSSSVPFLSANITLNTTPVMYMTRSKRTCICRFINYYLFKYLCIWNERLTFPKLPLPSTIRKWKSLALIKSLLPMLCGTSLS